MNTPASCTRRSAGGSGASPAIGPRANHPLFLARAEHVIAARSVLVGAAANCIHPNGAQGLNLGLRDVAVLARRLAAAAAAGRDIGDADVLAGYARERASDHRAVVRFTDMLAQCFSSRLPFASVLRNASLVAVDLNSAAKRALIRRGCGLIGLDEAGVASIP